MFMHTLILKNVVTITHVQSVHQHNFETLLKTTVCVEVFNYFICYYHAPSVFVIYAVFLA